MIRFLLTGNLHGDPQARTSKTGKPFTTAKLKADSPDGGQVWCSLIAFAPVGERLAPLKANAAIAVAGRAKVGGWVDRHGEIHGSLDVTVDEILTLDKTPTSSPALPRASPPPDYSPMPAPAGDLDDDIPFDLRGIAQCSPDHNLI